MGRALEIRDDLTAEQLRALAARERSNRAARRLLAIAVAPDGMSRADAATAAGMVRPSRRPVQGCSVRPCRPRMRRTLLRSTGARPAPRRRLFGSAVIRRHP